ncbi:hypothetical protein GGS24DRAFT_215893 [Hypoxylon argillaceum]|nr:hypothetical protein GGS24DRAFT_215893 [Hypoxylon argillaceum]
MAPLLPTLAAHARSILSSAATTRSRAVQTASDRLTKLGPLAIRTILVGRDDDSTSSNSQIDPSKGVTDPNDINNTAIFVLFGLIGVAFVVTGIWFFFWAKNGGFYFKENDWDDYKSTVLRRRGPNGTLLSGATPSTNLGGGSVYKDVDDGSTEYTGGLTQLSGDTGDTVSTLSGVTAGASDIAGREKRRRAREKKEREREKRRDRKARGDGGKSRRKVGEDGALVDEEAEAEAKQKLRAYRHERAARVGGLNKEPEGSEWDGSTNPEMSTVTGAESLLSNRQATPTKEKRRSTAAAANPRDYYETASEVTADTQSSAPTASSSSSNTRKAGGIRKVYSTADRTNTRENERLRAEARRLAERNRSSASASQSQRGGASTTTSSRRDFSYQRADLRSPASAIAEEAGEQQAPLMGTGRYLPAPESWTPAPPTAPAVAESDIADGSDLGTKSYRHYIPGLSSLSSSAAGPSSSVGTGSVVDSAVSGSEYAEEKRRKRREAQRAKK